MSKGKELPNSYLEPTKSRITNVVSSPSHPGSPLQPSIPPPPPPRNLNMTFTRQYSSASLEDRPGTLGIIEAANQQSFTTMTRIPSQNTCLQSHRNKMKLALIDTVLTVVLVTVPSVYTSVINQKTGMHNTNTSGPTWTKDPTEIPDISTTKIPNINTSVLTQRTEVPTANNHGMLIIFIT